MIEGKLLDDAMPHELQMRLESLFDLLWLDLREEFWNAYYDSTVVHLLLVLFLLFRHYPPLLVFFPDLFLRFFFCRVELYFCCFFSPTVFTTAFIVSISSNCS